MRLMILSLCLALGAAMGAAAQNAPQSLTQLHDALHLRPDQEAAWRDYTTAIGPDAQMTARRRATQQLLPQLTTPRRIALIQATMDQDIADFRRQGDAILAFYAGLTPDQQKTFDRQTLPPAGSDQSGP
jgi:hypothetical protein